MKRSRLYRQDFERVDRTRDYDLDEAVGLLKEFQGGQFDETVELALRLGINPKASDQAVRGTVALPKGTGKDVRVIVFAEGDEAEAAQAAGADDVGGQDLVERIEGGWLDFDVAIAAPAMMRNVGRLGRILGPRGLMPSPKSGTVTQDVGPAVEEFKAGKIEYRADSTGNVHVPVGKKSFPAEDLKANVEAFLDHIQQARPASAKGRFIRSAALSTTMSPGIRLAV
jgi:large subunit ribosomal protein L1